MSSVSDFAPAEPSSLNAGSGEVLHAAIASLWRRKLLVSAIAAGTVGFGTLTLIAMPPSYTAEAYIRGGFAASDAVAKDETDDDTRSGPAVSVDLSRVIETQSRLFKSYDLARRVVQQIGLDRLRPVLGENHWLPARFYGRAANSKQDEIDLAAATLSRGFSVTADPRTYMIEVNYTARDPYFAATIANAFVTEFLRGSRLQTLSLQRSSAAAALSRQLAVFGDKHPKVIRAQMRLAAADDLLRKQLDEPANVIRQNVGENVTKAMATPSKPKTPLVVGLLLLIGLAAGVAAALWLERRRWQESLLRYYTRPFV